MVMEEESTTAITSKILEEKIYVAVGRKITKNRSNLIWALENYQEHKICILHIHQPSQTIPILGTKFGASTADEELVRAFREKENAKMDKILQEYLNICLKKGVQAEKLCIEMDSVEKGIVETINQYKIRKLVMAAAADYYYSMEMDDVKSKKANFVCEQAPVSCQIQFTCKRNLIYTREARMDEVRSLSTLLSEFQKLVLPQINEIQEVGSSNREIVVVEMESNRTSSAESSSSSHVFPCNGMGLNNVMNFLINSAKIWQKLTIQNHEHCE